MGLARDNVSILPVGIIWLINIFWIASFLLFLQSASLSICVSSFTIFVEISSLVFLFFLNLNNLVWQVLNSWGQNNIFFVNKKLNIIQSLSSLPISNGTSSWLINYNNGSFLIRDKDNLIIMIKFSWILQNSFDVLRFFHLIHAFVIINTNVGDVLDGWIVKIILSHSKILVVLELDIWVSVILMLLSDLSQNV